MATPDKTMITPFRFRELMSRMLVTNEVGDYGVFETDVVDRLFTGALTEGEKAKLQDLSILIEPNSEWRLASLRRRISTKYSTQATKLTYLILVPTLRCNLSCGYCQVSRAPLDAQGFDWGDEQIDDFEKFLEHVDTDNVKIEFQGGEPTVRPDLVSRIMKVCERNIEHVEFAICTNLITLTKEIEALFERDNVVISTSIDGPVDVMTKNRTESNEVSKTFF